MREFAIKNRETNMYESFIFKGKPVIQTDAKENVLLMARLEDNDFSKYYTIKNGNIVTKIDLPEDVEIKITSRQSFSYTVPQEEHVYYNKRKVKNFLYEIDYGKIDYGYACDFFSTQMIDAPEGMCSSVHNGRFYGRNLDWLYDSNVDFVVHSPKSEGRYAVLGVAGNAPDIVADKVDQDVIDHNGYDMFKVLPFFLLDGVNERGVFINSNVAPLNTENETVVSGVIPAAVEEKERLCTKMIPRFVLDNFSSAKNAVEYIRDYVTLYFPSSTMKIDYQIHFMVGDRRSTYALEFVNGKTEYRQVNQLTNFHVMNVSFNNDGKVFTPEDVVFDKDNKPTLKNNVEKYGAGLERWNLIIDKYGSTSTKEGMRKMMESLYYSRTYKGGGRDPEKPWHSEYAHGRNDLWIEDGMPDSEDPKYFVTVDSIPSEYSKVETIAGEMFDVKERDTTSTWITVHSSVYDLQTKTLYLKTQEEDGEMVFYM